MTPYLPLLLAIALTGCQKPETPYSRPEETNVVMMDIGPDIPLINEVYEAEIRRICREEIEKAVESKAKKD